MTGRKLAATLVAGLLFAAAAWTTATPDRQRRLVERFQASRDFWARRIAAICERVRLSERTRPILGWCLALFAPAILALLTLSILWITNHTPMPAAVASALRISFLLNSLLAPIIAAAGALLIRGPLPMRIAIGLVAFFAAFFTYDIAVTTLDALFGMSLFEA